MPFADVACLIISAQAAPVADFARTTYECNALGTVITLNRQASVHERGDVRC